MTNRMKELFQKDKYELVDTIIIKEKQIKILDKYVGSRLKDCLYQFVEYYTIDETDRIDMKIVAESFLEKGFPKEEE